MVSHACELLRKGTRRHKQKARMSVQWFRSCLSLSLLQEGSRDSTCARCEQVDGLLSLVAELKLKLKAGGGGAEGRWGGVCGGREREVCWLTSKGFGCLDFS